MPVYEYQCQACQATWELDQKIVEAPVTECPKCHEPKAKRLISRTSFILQGGGWYAEGYSK